MHLSGRMHFAFKNFDELAASEIYKILQAREQVFNLEQNCLYRDLDDKDQAAYHLWSEAKDGSLEAYARLLPPGLSFSEWSVGRVLTVRSKRGQGLGKLIMREAIKRIFELAGQKVAIRISAQSYLEKFYSEFGFTSTGKSYFEDDIPHLEMLMEERQA